MTRPIVWDLVANPRRFNAGFREAQRTADRSGRVIRRTASLIGGAFAAVQVAGFLKGAIDEAREAAKVGRQTQAVIKATGGVAKVSARDVDRLADSLSRKVGVDDEIIASGANMLLTFKGVRNEVGRGNDVFTQASSVILDMTAAMHQGQVTQQGLEKASIQVGKALNDPIRGITALTRVGVTFTQAQKDQIKALVEAGKTQQAQKIILAELRSEFGGAAAAAADAGQRLGVVWANIKERIGAVLLPALEGAAGAIGDRLVPAAERFWAKHGPAFGKAFDDIRTKAATFFAELRDNLEPQLDRIKDAWRENKDAIRELVSSLRGSQDEFATAEDTAKSFGDTLVKAIEFAGSLSRALKRVEGHLNDFADSSQKSAHKLHVQFFRPLAVSMGVLAGRWVAAFHGMVRVAATAAEAMRLPWARSIRRAEQDIGGFRATFNRQMDALRDERVNLNVRGTFTPPPGMSMRDIVFRHAGGPITSGVRSRDSAWAMVRKGEHVWTPEEVDAAGGHGAMYRLRQAALAGRFAGGFARGGAVELLQHLPSAGAMARAGGSTIDRIAQLVRSNVQASAKVLLAAKAAVSAFIRSTDRLPYRWGAAGPLAYDCSGLAGAVYGKHSGRGGGSGQRYFTTASIGTHVAGLKPGLGGVLNIGVTPGQGHMSGSYAGLGFEARSTRSGIIVGPGARSPASFARHFHMARGGPVDERMIAALALLGADVGGDAGRLRVNGKVFDQGGWLMPGATLAVNRTGRPEPVGIDADYLAKAIARELAKVIPQPPGIRELQAGMNWYAGRMGQAPPFR